MKIHKVIIFVLEAGLLLVILSQIVSLSGVNNGESRTVTASPAQITDTVVAINADTSAPNTPLTRSEIMKSLAEREAQRIVETGDVEALQKRVDDNRGVLRLLGYTP
ncbi:MAG: hypothetical protein KKA05_00970 [Alphaproteobacteria bacterium]|nr:hypothetical protein [Alphaproteobacteria bacterium]MBU0858568.1 hypothetical protein [Alphaproteobacteria bacterium]